MMCAPTALTGQKFTQLKADAEKIMCQSKDVNVAEAILTQQGLWAADA